MIVSRSIIQSKFIMKKIGLHNENLLYLTAGRIHAILLIGGLAFNIVTGNIVVIPDMQGLYIVILLLINLCNILRCLNVH